MSREYVLQPFRGAVNLQIDYASELNGQQYAAVWTDGMRAAGWIETRPGDDDPGAIELLHKLAKKQRARWPEFAVDAVALSGRDSERVGVVSHELGTTVMCDTPVDVRL